MPESPLFPLPVVPASAGKITMVITGPQIEMITGHPDTLAALTAGVSGRLRSVWPDAEVSDYHGFPLVPDESVQIGLIRMCPMLKIPDDPLDATVHKALLELTRALKRRIAQQVGEAFPGARTVRTSLNEYAMRHYVYQVCGPHGRMLYSQESDGPWPMSLTEVVHDVDLLVRLVPPTGWLYVNPLSGGGWSVALSEAGNR